MVTAENFVKFLIVLVLLLIGGSILKWALHRKGFTLTKHGRKRDGKPSRRRVREARRKVKQR